MRCHGFPSVPLRLTPRRVAPFVALLLTAASWLSPRSASAQVIPITFQNASDSTIVSLQASPFTPGTPLGPNVLTRPLLAGQSVPVELPMNPTAECNYVFVIVTRDDREFDMNENLCDTHTVTFTWVD